MSPRTRFPEASFIVSAGSRLYRFRHMRTHSIIDNSLRICTRDIAICKSLATIRSTLKKRSIEIEKQSLSIYRQISHSDEALKQAADSPKKKNGRT